MSQAIALTEPLDAEIGRHAGIFRARLEIRAGRPVGLSAEVEVTPAGVIAVGALVSAILLSTGVLIRLTRPARRELPHHRNA